MNVLDRLERKFGRFAIPNLMLYLVVLYGFGFVANLVHPQLYQEFLSLDAMRIMQGQVWRLFTFLMVPPTASVLFLLIICYMYYFLGTQLERYWGSFRFTLYIVVGLILHWIAAIGLYLVLDLRYLMGTEYLNLSVFLAFAATFPNTEFRLYFLIPIKAKYIGMLTGAWFAVTIIAGFLPMDLRPSGLMGFSPATSVAALLSLGNFLLFWLLQSTRYKTKRKKVASGRRVAGEKVLHFRAKEPVTRHRCSVCGRTELDDPTLEFRFCSKCDGAHEYCSDHLYTHVHITEENRE
ncbi:MAG: rhomboid family intramembrane serine protease [Lachnospiraceae bacterium]|nr:rhomboid family intramembrane serine protease [Lachnospiraceae bacterium]MDY5742501.1 rhomboid family intramembrane serine protease [Lachnospiraceae bacterium]